MLNSAGEHRLQDIIKKIEARKFVEETLYIPLEDLEWLAVSLYESNEFLKKKSSRAR